MKLFVLVLAVAALMLVGAGSSLGVPFPPPDSQKTLSVTTPSGLTPVDNGGMPIGSPISASSLGLGIAGASAARSDVVGIACPT